MKTARKPSIDPLAQAQASAMFNTTDHDMVTERRRRALENARADADLIRERCTTLIGFVREAWHILEPAKVFVEDDVIEAVAAHLEAVTRGEITRLLINVPPGMMKSLLVSVFWPAWEWGPAGMPHLGILSTSFSQSNVMRDNGKMRRLIESAWYQALWGDQVQLRSDTNAKRKFDNTAGGGREGRPFGSMTGGRGDRVIIDDPHSTKTAESDKQRSATVTLFREQISDRLNDITHSAIVVIMQRLHTEDVAGCIIAMDEGYVHLNLAMEFEADMPRCVTPWFTDKRKKDGELLSPIRFPAKEIAKLKRMKGAYAWAGQYQQRPAPRQGGFFKTEKLGEVRAVPPGARYGRAWDLAATAEKPGLDPDYTAGCKMAMQDGKFFIAHMIRVRESSGAVRVTIKNTATRDGDECKIHIPQDPGQAGKDQAQSYITLLQGFPIRTSSVKGDKTQRADPFAAQVEGGNVFIVRTGDPVADEWIDPFLTELRVFPVGHDDQVDAAGDAFKLLCEQSSQGWFDYYREMAGNLKAPQQAT